MTAVGISLSFIVSQVCWSSLFLAPLCNQSSFPPGARPMGLGPHGVLTLSALFGVASSLLSASLGVLSRVALYPWDKLSLASSYSAVFPGNILLSAFWQELYLTSISIWGEAHLLLMLCWVIQLMKIVGLFMFLDLWLLSSMLNISSCLFPIS